MGTWKKCRDDDGQNFILRHRHMKNYEITRQVWEGRNCVWSEESTVWQEEISIGRKVDGSRGIGIGIDFDICSWSYRPVSEPLFWLLVPNPYWPFWSKKRKHNYQKKASSRNAILSITFMNYVMKEYTNLSYMSRWAGVFLRRLNEIYIDNTPGTDSDACHIETVPVILNALGGKHVHFPLLPSVRTTIVQSGTKWLLISAMCHIG